MRDLIKLFFTIILTMVSMIALGNQKQLRVFQLNIWQEGTMIEKGYEAIVEEILDKDADVVMLSEVRNYKGVDFVQRLISSLKDHGVNYYGESSHPKLDVAFLSKYPIEDQQPLYDKDKQIASVLKSRIKVNNKQFLFYSVHLDYTNYACYLPRGYDGVTWKKLDQKITDVAAIVTANKKSKRDEAIVDILNDIKKESKNQTIMIAGDFNEPSHLDWIDETKNLYDHSGTVIPWDCSILLAEAKFTDSFRKIYPNPVTHPGFTFASFNKDAELSKLAWAPEADDRDRIDYIYFKSNNKVSLKNIQIVGPVETICYGIKQEKDSNDDFLLPKDRWPTDHKGLLATFVWK